MKSVLVNIQINNCDGYKHSGDNYDRIVRPNPYFHTVPNYNADRDMAAMFVKNVQFTPPTEYAALVKAIEGFHYAMGSVKLCGHCFNHELQDGRSAGCCGSCTQLSDKGCTAKPVRCAAYTCDFIQNAYNQDLLREYSDLLNGMDGLKLYFHDYFDRGYSNDMAKSWSVEQLLAMKELAKKFDSLTARAIPIDWNDTNMLKKIRFSPKVNS